MPAINNSISNLSVENQTFYDRTLLSRLLPDLHFYNDAKKKMTDNYFCVNFRVSLPKNAFNW